MAEPRKEGTQSLLYQLLRKVTCVDPFSTISPGNVNLDEFCNQLGFVKAKLLPSLRMTMEIEYCEVFHVEKKRGSSRLEEHFLLNFVSDMLWGI